jgi:methylenetetrahydrofolate dehydrogenase (NADP+)/methenyltetrahydrofolate cyclohydrolase
MILIDGKEIAAVLKQEIADEVTNIITNGGKRPHLAAILVGHDGGSETYVAAKVKACELVGFESTLIRFEDSVTEDELLNCIRGLNTNAAIDGFIVQLPLPKHISEESVIESIDPAKEGWLPECQPMFLLHPLGSWSCSVVTRLRHQVKIVL